MSPESKERDLITEMCGMRSVMRIARGRHDVNMMGMPGFDR